MDDEITHEPRTVPAGHGLSWIKEGYRYFSASPLSWFGLSCLFLFVTMFLSVIPLANILVQIIMPFMVAILMLACKEQDETGELAFNNFSNWLPTNAGTLIKIGVLYFIATIIVFVLMIVLAFFSIGGMEGISQLSGENPDAILENLDNLFVLLLVGMALQVPILMAMWFAPVIAAVDKVGTLDALRLSFNACALNVIPFTIYGLVVFVLAILASIPLMLGWLVLIPVLMAALFASYKDIFLTENE